MLIIFRTIIVAVLPLVGLVLLMVSTVAVRSYEVAMFAALGLGGIIAGIVVAVRGGMIRVMVAVALTILVVVAILWVLTLGTPERTPFIWM
jgi:hypothetical protein